MKAGPRSDRLYMAHIVEACEKIERYLSGLTKDDFLEDSRTVDAVVRNFEVMGEAAKRISAETRDAHPNVPSSDIARFRDVLIHRYDEVVPRQVWRIAREEMPSAYESTRRAAESNGDP